MFHFRWVLLLSLSLAGLISSQTPEKEENICARSSCYPATGDLLVGRQDKLKASSTCGLKRWAEYCIISNLQGSGNCKYCDSRKGSPQVMSHLPKNMLLLFQNEPKTTWWQSENGKENVFLQLDFEAQFHVTHVVMKFKSFRPAAMLIERSYDYGKTWEVIRYFAKNCESSFPDIPASVPRGSSDVYCTSEYSSIEPSSGGEVVYKALNPGIPESAAWTTKVQNLLRMTNIRINFTKLNTLGDDIIDNSPEITKKYFYAVNWLVIRGSCSCYGHAKRCLAPPGSPDLPGMVHSLCNCTHNTAGLNCERCKDGYQDRPWSPAFPGQPNECKKCECNGHTDKCRFDRAVWEASGRTSGGVCLECQHNTIGPKCEKCKPLHYQDPSKSIRDPDVCKPCDCDPVGSVGRGECEMVDKPAENLRAGQCICKKNVEGPRCDRCKKGFYDLQQDDPSGCKACRCDPLGTVGRLGCDSGSGKCQCKRFVVGQRCDNCLAGYWGLATGAGCKPCECDVGGSYDNLCDLASGQCRCRPGIEGRKCDRVIPGYYFALSDNLKYEAEKARGIGVTSINPLERPVGTKIEWTDVGSLKITEGNGVEFGITNVPMTGNYKFVMRFNPKTSSLWEEIKLTISRADGQRTINGECGNALSSNGNAFFITMQEYQSLRAIEKMMCLERGVDYFVRLDFNRRQGPVDHVYLDSLVLVPSMESVSIFQGDTGQTRLEDFKRFRCESPHLPANLPRPVVHSVCRKLHFSGSAIIYDGALPCSCNQIGTVQNKSGLYVCDDAGGQCPCKSNVIGRRCEKCAPGSYKFSSTGCSPCNCDYRGSYDNLCDVQTGQCKCNDLGTGRQCNECPPREWGFPICRPCECNGHASTCDPVTGVCIECQHNTAGDKCELCKAGYFGNATKGTSTDCQRCQCPGGSSGNQFSPTCTIDTSTSPPTFTCDQCPPGYEGKQCEECSDGYYGNPLIPGGKCVKCDCNNNVDFSKKGGCDRRTGECLRCMNNTAGYRCDVCKRGYYGNAKNQTCKPCNCYALGTSQSSGTCNASTGQCPCKPNVVGRSCNRCAFGHWNLGSGQGCKSCDCCVEGATSAQCDESTGVCQCRRDFGGLKCCDCEDDFWGKPPAQCKPCDCNPSGSLRSQCDRQTGKCSCNPGISGRKCNKCQPDTTRDFPECEFCHPCYYSWKIIIDDLEKLARKVKYSVTARNVSVDYETDLKRLEDILRRIREILGNRTTYPKHVEDIQKRISEGKERIVKLIQTTNKTQEDLESTESRTKIAKKEIEKLRDFLQRLSVLIEQYGRNLTDVKDEIPHELVNSTRASLVKSTKALDISENVRKTLMESQKERFEIEKKLPDYNSKKKRISEKLDRYLLEFGNLDDLIAKVNRLVCGLPGDGCGGCNSTGCVNCGGSGCDGATTLAKKALETAKMAERALWEKERKANATLADVIEAEIAVNVSKKEAEIALKLAKAVHSKSLNTSVKLSGLIEEIYIFLNESRVDPDEVRRIAEFVLGRKLNISEEEIKLLGNRIRSAVTQLSGIDAILNETSQDLLLLEELKKQAIQANSTATQTAEIAKEVSSKLSEASVTQERSSTSVKKAKRKINEVEVILLEIETRLNKTLNKSVESVRITKSMKTRLDPLDEKFDENKKMLIKAEKEVKEAVVISNHSKTEAKNLQNRFQEVNARYNRRLEEQNNFRERLEKVRSDAESLKMSLTSKLRIIEGYLSKRVELDNLIDELKKLETDSLETFCESRDKNEYILSCVPQTGAPSQYTKQSDKFCDRPDDF